MKCAVISLVKGYKVFSSVLRSMGFPVGDCRFSPTCSDYMQAAVEKYGVGRGVLLGIWRIFRCNPFSSGGHDPV